MTLKSIIDESKNHFMTPEAFNEAFNRLKLAQLLAEAVIKNDVNAPYWAMPCKECAKLAKELLGE